MVRDELSVLSAFLTVAEERSFTRAAKRLGVSTSALSHAIKGLEEHFGVPLLARTTRSVAPTDAGAQLITRLRPALGDIQGALDQISGLRDRPAGRVRLVVSPIAASTVLAPKLGQFARDYPDVVLDVEIMVRAAVDGVGLAFMSEERAAPHLASGELVRVLDDWCPPFPGFFLYYPRQRQLPAALAALVETLRL